MSVNSSNELRGVSDPDTLKSLKGLKGLNGLTGMQYIDGSWCVGEAGSFYSKNPATAAEIPQEYSKASQVQAEQACISAAKAAQEFAAVSLVQRAGFLRACADEIMALGDQLIEQVTLETGYPAMRGQGERARTCGQLKLFAESILQGDFLDARIDTALPEREPIPRPDLRYVNQALGPVVVFGASNFPLAFSVAGGDTASAFAAGCPVIVKGHPAHPGTSELVAIAIVRAAEKTKMPQGVFNYVIDDGISLGCQLVQAPEVKAVGFTGSHRAGLALFKLANERPEPIPVFAEMGSVNPVFLCHDKLAADAEEIAKGFLTSLTMGTGQFCVNPGLVIAEKGEALNRFLSSVCEGLADCEAGLMLNEQVCVNYLQGIEQLVESVGVELVQQGKPGSDQAFRGQASLFKVSAEQFLASPNLQQEVFGPASIIIECEDSSEYIRIADALAGQLTATLHATEQELENSSQLVDALMSRVGRLVINGFPTGVEVSPAIVHGGPYPASTDARFTSVGTAAVQRFVRPVCYQNYPEKLLPDALRDTNPLNISRTINGQAGDKV